MKTFTLTLLVSILASVSVFSQTVSIPDSNFEQALIDLGYDTVLDNTVQASNVNTVTSLNVENRNISNLKGIEAFTALELLYVDDNNLTTLDVTQNAALAILTCSNNNLTELDVTQNTDLDQLDARFNMLTDLDVRQNTVLQGLSVNGNQLTLLNLNQNGILVVLNCADNNLGGISLLNGNNSGIISFDATNNSGLLCIQVDDVAFANANFTNIDPQTNFSTSCLSQLNTYVPDDNFEQALIDLGYDSGALDDYVPTANINTVTELDVVNLNIDDLTGIKDFDALETLSCDSNNLTSLDVSQNTALTVLRCSQNLITNSIDLSQNTNLIEFNCFLNLLTSLDISQNIVLETLVCSVNGISTIDVSQNTELIHLNVGYNQLTDLDITNNTELNTLICEQNPITSLDASQNTNLTGLDCRFNELENLNVKNGNNTNFVNNTSGFIGFKATNNPNLTCIEVDDVAYSNTNWTNVDPQTSFSLDCNAQQTFVPDDNFEQALIDLGYDSGALDDFVPTANINSITQLYIVDKNIADLTGVEDFIALEILSCSNNPISTIDVSNLTALRELYCSTNNLTSLDVSSNTELTDLFFGNNDITTIDVSNNAQLAVLNFAFSNLTSVDISNNTNLLELYVRQSSLSNLDLSNNTVLEVLSCDFNQLTNLSLDNNVNLEFLDCKNNNIAELDLNINTELTELFCQNNALTLLNVKNGNNTNFTNFEADNNPDLTCIEVDDVAYSNANWTDIDPQTSFSEDCNKPAGFTYVPDDNFEQALIDLGYDSEPLDDLVPTANIETVAALDVRAENINDLTGIEDFIALEELECDSNNLTELNISENTALTHLDCNSNQLSSLDVSLNTQLIEFISYANQLTVLDVSQNTLLENLQCHNNQLSSLDVSQNTALVELFCAENQLTSLDVALNTQLVELACSYNNLITLDVSQNILLDELKCAFNELSNLDVNANTQLSRLDVKNNLLSSIDVSQNTVLEVLDCRNNQLTNVDLTLNNQLTFLYCKNNQLTQLNLNQNNLLEGVYCHNNQLQNLDLSLNTALFALRCEDNELTNLNVKNSNNTNFTIFDASNNPNLTCIEVDDVSYSTTNWPNIDTQTSFSENCGGIDCEDAQTIMVSNTVNSVDFDLTNEPLNDQGCGGTTSNDYADTWFEFTMPEDGAVGINGNVNANNFALYDACAGNEISCFNNNSVIDGLTTGITYKLRVFRIAANAGNTNAISFHIVLASTLGTENASFSEDDIQLYPNPSSAIVHIKTPMDTKVEILTVTDVSGKRILVQNNQNSFNSSQFASGIYFVRLKIDTYWMTKRLIVKH
ncbi:MAG: leucine-rich repeat domain-containing protein [Psychroserpens sp.]|uniref:T9SS type A sorting domain-containing protein n=1 Tax=Psychroserpens sp. TaxID=2020870 RepID=UPI003C759814